MISLWNFIRPHLFYWVLFAVALFAFRTWIVDHDARLLAEQTIKQSEKAISDLRAQIATRSAQAQTAKQAIIREVAAAKTPEQQIAEIPRLTLRPLNPEPLPDAPSAVKVELEPLIEQLAACKTDALDLGVCHANLDSQDLIDSAKDEEIAALKKKPNFWHRLAADAKKIAIGAAIGGAAVAIARR